MRVSTQRGSVVSFIIMALLLVFIAGGAIYLARTYSNSDAEVTVSDEVTKAPAESEDAESDKPAAPAPSPEDEKKETAPAQKPQDSDKSTTTTSSDRDELVGVDQYSQTGPADTMMQLVAVGALSSAGAAYVTSRRRSSL